MIAPFKTNNEILVEVGDRIRRHRLNQNTTIEDIAKHAGLSAKTIYAIETGQDVKFSSFIKCLRSLGLLDILNAAIPDSLPSQISFVSSSSMETRVRASKKKSNSL